MPVEIEFARLHLMPVPGNVNIDGIDADRAIAIQQGLPLIARNTKIKNAAE